MRWLFLLLAACSGSETSTDARCGPDFGNLGTEPPVPTVIDDHTTLVLNKPSPTIQDSYYIISMTYRTALPPGTYTIPMVVTPITECDVCGNISFRVNGSDAFMANYRANAGTMKIEGTPPKVTAKNVQFVQTYNNVLPEECAPAVDSVVFQTP